MPLGCENARDLVPDVVYQGAHLEAVQYVPRRHIISLVCQRERLMELIERAPDQLGELIRPALLLEIIGTQCAKLLELQRDILQSVVVGLKIFAIFGQQECPHAAGGVPKRDE